MLPKARMQCIAMYEDNEGAIQTAKHPISNSNSKHIDVRHHFLRELVERKEIEIIHVSTEYQHADFLTKALPEKEFAFHRGIVMNLMWFLSRILFDFLIFYFFMFGLFSDLYQVFIKVDGVGFKMIDGTYWIVFVV